eukprot:4204948-Pyramimonas_sp.AAC.1
MSLRPRSVLHFGPRSLLRLQAGQSHRGSSSGASQISNGGFLRMKSQGVLFSEPLVQRTFK